MDSIEKASEKLKLICIPYAGGSASIYLQWKRYIHPRVELMPMELSGRGKRLTEPFYKTWDECVDDLYCKIQPWIHDSRYMIFGHSMGATLAFELARLIERSPYRKPIHIVFSGRRSPNRMDREKPSEKSEEEFKEYIIKMGGTPKEVFDNEELYNLFMPILRADYKMLDGYEYQERGKLSCPISIFYGLKDPETSDDKLDQWSGFSPVKCDKYPFHGDHFYINDQVKLVVGKLNEIINGIVS